MSDDLDADYRALVASGSEPLAEPKVAGTGGRPPGVRPGSERSPRRAAAARGRFPNGAGGGRPRQVIRLLLRPCRRPGLCARRLRRPPRGSGDPELLPDRAAVAVSRYEVVRPD